LASQTSIEDFADELFEIIDSELDGIAAFRPVQIETLAESMTGLKNVRAKAIFHAFSRIGYVNIGARAKIDGVVTRFHVYSTKSEGDKIGDKIGDIVKKSADMVNKRLAVG